MLSNFKITYKVYLMGLAQIILISVIGLTGILQMAKISEELVEIAEEDIPLTRMLTLLTEHQLQQSINYEKALLNGLLMAQGDEKAKQAYTQLRSKIRSNDLTIKRELTEVKQFIEEGINLLHSKEAIAEFKKLLAEVNKVTNEYSQLNRGIEASLEKIDSGNMDYNFIRENKIEELQDTVDHHLVSMLNEIQDFTLAASLKAEKDEQAGIKWMLITFVVGILIAMILPYLISRSIVSPIRELNERLTDMVEGQGDLTIRLPDKAKDETGDTARLFNRFLGKLRDVIGHVNYSADALGESSETAIRVMQSTLTNVEKQRSETEMVASAVYEMSTTTQDVAKNTANASQVAESVKTRVSEGRIAATETQTIIQRLATEVSDAETVIESLADETKNIGTVLDAIRGIAEQTNLLALNAAIEAARAGDTGRGFAVVADEVRSLAQRTQTSTGDIQTLVETLQAEARKAVESMQHGSESTEKCLHASSEAAKAFDDASEAVTEISDLNTQIAIAAEQQSSVAEEINENLVNIKNVAVETAEGAQETTKANEVIANRLMELHTSLNQFQI